MLLILALVIFAAFIAALAGPLFRPWVIGVALILCGFAVHAAFEVWVADWAGRLEMGSFAIVEAMLFLSGLGCTLAGLLGTELVDARPAVRAGAWALWLLVALVSAWSVLDRLPP